ncbi:Aminomethyltransferase folate-binding domain-containing protein [Amniculicola lignicola CBS 123094]|uniref:Iron-sulfur cluster assembly factor IBA57 homolog, mitochondrial n=1 Tax=Amniculicola lignicola CBS 123094 TaxID=1392246 RepID=A0A6A5X1L8_9PLEO|nr:Aminomethyltransferase folate-binding domain-containing protein [Amniculicola lignicola CBS 123094]
MAETRHNIHRSKPSLPGQAPPATPLLPRCLTTTNRSPAPATEGVVQLSHRRLISLSGSDAAKFLQGLITNNVIANNHSNFYSAFLDARGRVLWDVFVWSHPGPANKEWGCYIEVDGADVEILMKHLKKHKLRSKIKIQIVGEEEDLSIWAAWGPDLIQLQEPSMIISLKDPRAHNFGDRYLIRGDAASMEYSGQYPVVDLQQYHLRRYLFGIAEGQKEIQRESALPMECNVDLSEGINFNKGCYVGQELTIRTKHTGVVRKRMLPVQLYHAGDPIPSNTDAVSFDSGWSDAPPETGSDIKQLDDQGSIKKGRATGKFIAGIGNVGLALCRLEMMTSMRISAEGGNWRPGMEFAVQGKDGEVDSQIRVRAVVPEWLKEREQALWEKGRSKSIHQ